MARNFVAHPYAFPFIKSNNFGSLPNFDSLALIKDPIYKGRRRRKSITTPTPPFD